MTIRIDADYVIETLQRLVQIDSTNPTLAAANAGEGEIAAVLVELIEELGMEAALHEIAPGRPNVVGIFKGSGGGRSLMLNGHTDTVGVEGMAEPFSGAIRNGKLYGRGAQDMKGSLAAMLGAAKAIRDAQIELSGDLILAFVIDEETFSEGTADLVKQYVTDAAIVTEPTDLTLTRAHRGFIWFEVETFGRAAHGSRYAEGIDANMRMGRFLAQLDQLSESCAPDRPIRSLARPPYMLRLLKGGVR